MKYPDLHRKVMFAKPTALTWVQLGVEVLFTKGFFAMN